METHTDPTDHPTNRTRNILLAGLAAVVGLGIIGNIVEDDEPSTPTRQPAVVQTDELIVDAGWSTLTSAEQEAACELFWVSDDADIINILTSPPDAITQHQAEMAVDHFYDVC